MNQKPRKLPPLKPSTVPLPPPICIDPVMETVDWSRCEMARTYPRWDDYIDEAVVSADINEHLDAL